MPFFLSDLFLLSVNLHALVNICSEGEHIDEKSECFQKCGGDQMQN